MLLFIEQGVRGGVSMITHRHARSNIPKTDGYDASQDTQYIMYWDANNYMDGLCPKPCPMENLNRTPQKYGARTLLCNFDLMLLKGIFSR